MKNKSIAFFVLWTLFAQYIFAQSENDIIMPNSPKTNNSEVNIAELDKGYWCSIEAGGGCTTMQGMKNVAMTEFTFTNGYRFSQYLKLGIGFGGLWYINNSNVRKDNRSLAMPIFCNIRGNILSDNTRMTVPYWSLNIGSTIGDAFFMTPTIGIKIGEKRSAWLVGIGYSLRDLQITNGQYKSYHSAFLRVGYEY